MKSGVKWPEGDACSLARREVELCGCGWALPLISTPHTKEDVDDGEGIPPLRYDMGVIIVCPECHRVFPFTFSKDERVLS